MHQSLIAICVGNTRTRFGLFAAADLQRVEVAASTDHDAVRSSLSTLLEAAAGSPTIAIASVNPPASAAIADIARSLTDPDAIGFIGRDIPIPLQHDLDDASTVGQDRWLCALAAYTRTQQACLVIDIGTAITIDFIDGTGVFRGGLIVPGLTMMLQALHEHTASLPLLPFQMPEAERGPLGQSTAHAMRLGVLAAARGAVRVQLEAVAEFYSAYPQVIATGGDMAALEADGFIEHFVPDLQLLGVHAAVAALTADHAP